MSKPKIALLFTQTICKLTLSLFPSSKHLPDRLFHLVVTREVCHLFFELYPSKTAEPTRQLSLFLLTLIQSTSAVLESANILLICSALGACDHEFRFAYLDLPV